VPPVNDLIRRLAQRKVPVLLPGGMPLVLAQDVADGHLRAAERATVGARFILSGSFHTLRELARGVADLVPQARVPPVMPMAVGWAIALASEPVARLVGRPPIVQRGDLHFLAWRPHPSARRARDELGWTATPLADGLERTIEHFRAKQWI
jgi:dihydroflavonol-4-reductase